MLGIIPAAGAGSRIQPLAFSKELLPVGCWFDGETERPRAVSEYLVDRMILAGSNRIIFVISPGKSDILSYYGGNLGSTNFAYVVQPRPAGLCDAIFRALPLVPCDEMVVIGLPDTVWFPEDGLCRLPNDALSFLLFPVDQPEFFDAVLLDDSDRVQEIQVKQRGARSNWIWGAFAMPGSILHALYRLWTERQQRDEYIGTLVNAFLAEGGLALGIRAGESYVDLGTLHGYRAAMELLRSSIPTDGSQRQTVYGSRDLPSAPQPILSRSHD